VKPKRTVDKALLERIKQNPCAACSYEGSEYRPIDAHHIRSVGAGGPDEEFNVVPLCRTCHVGLHKAGTQRFCRRKQGLWVALQSLGWEFLGHKLWNDKLRK